MTLTIPASTLAAALKAASSIVETKNTLPLLSMVCFDGTTITTSNLDIEYRQELDATGSIQCAVDAKRLAAWASVASGMITLALDGHTLTAKAGRSRLALPALPIADFPMMTVANLGKAMAVDLAPIAKRTLWAASNEVTRAYLNGIFMNDEAGKARFVSTDGYRVASVTTNKWPDGSQDVIMPSNLAKVIADAGPGNLEWSDRWFRMRC